MELKGLELGVKILDAGNIIFSERKIIEENVAQFEAVIEEIRAWSSEYPNLYDLAITLYDPAGKIIESTATKIGFRTLRLKILIFLLMVNIFTSKV